MKMNLPTRKDMNFDKALELCSEIARATNSSVNNIQAVFFQDAFEKCSASNQERILNVMNDFLKFKKIEQQQGEIQNEKVL